jgi:Helix-turn-helix domain
MRNKLSTKKCKNNLPQPHTTSWATLEHYKNTALCMLRSMSCVNTYVFNDAGIKSPSLAIKQLRNDGFIISMSRADIRSSDGILHKKVATYCLKTSRYQRNTIASQRSLF